MNRAAWVIGQRVSDNDKKFTGVSSTDNRHNLYAMYERQQKMDLKKKPQYPVSLIKYLIDSVLKNHPKAQEINSLSPSVQILYRGELIPSILQPT